MKNILLPVLLLMIVLVSCNQDNVGPLFDSKGVDYVAVGVTSVEEVYALNNENEFSIMFPIHRTDKTKSGTVANLLLVDESGLFELESSVITFEEGSGFGYAKIVASNKSLIDPATIYNLELNVTGDNASLLYNKATFKAQLELSYTSLGEGSFTSQVLETTSQTEVLKADGIDVYKLLSLYGDGFDILVVLNGSVVTVASQPAWISSTYGKVYVEGTGTVEGNVITMNLKHFVPDVGAFGTFVEVLTLP